MSLSLLGVLVLMMGLCLIATSIWFWFRYQTRKRFATTQGVVSKVDPDSSSRIGTVQFSPEGQLLVGGQPYQVRAGIQTGVNVGDAIPVYYDPHDPSQATIYAPGRSLLMVAVLGVNGAITLPLAAMLGLWLGPLQAARDDTLAEFIYAVRSDNSARISSLSATGAQVTPEFVARAKKSGAHRLGSNNIGFSSDACVEVFFDSDPRPHYVYMQKPSDWRIVRANANDPYCIDDLRD